MNIIHLTFNFPPDIGGVGQYVLNLSDCLEKSGIKVFVISLPQATPIYQVQSPNYPVFHLKVIKLPFSDPIPINLFGMLRTLVKTREPTILHLHGHSTFLSFFGAFFSMFLRVPYITTHHGEGLESSVLSKLNGQLRREIIAKFVLKHSKLIISVAQTEVEAITTKYGVSKQKVKVIHNGIKLNGLISPSPNDKFVNEFCHKKVILSGGVLARWKGFEYLVRAMHLVTKENKDVLLVITGKGPDQSRLQSIVSSLNLDKFVKFTGRLDSGLIPAFYKVSYMFVLPSLYDVCPTSVLEAMGSGKPVVATSNGGQKELVINNVNGFIVPPSDIKSLSEAILTLLSNEELALQMGKEGQRMAEEKFEWAVLSEMIIQEYAYLLYRKVGS